MTSAKSSTAHPEPAVVRHTFDASPSEVFEAWVSAELIEQWWGPEGYTTKVLALDATQGGQFSFEMTAPSGESCRMTGSYREIKRPTLLVIDMADHCNIGLPESIEPQLASSVLRVEFVELGAKTEVKLTHSPLNSGYSALAAASWGQALSKLSSLTARVDGGLQGTKANEKTKENS